MKSSFKHGKHSAPSQNFRNAEKSGKSSRKRIFTISVIALLCAIVSVATLAYVYTNTDAIENIFTGSEVSCQVTEEFDGETKKNVAVENTGNTESYIRAMVNVTWMSEDGTHVSAIVPVNDIDYTISFASNNGWVESSDGFWYYTQTVRAGDSTKVLINSCTLEPGANVPEGYYLSVEIIASSIQSTPTSVVEEQWSSGVASVGDNGILTIK